MEVAPSYDHGRHTKLNTVRYPNLMCPILAEVTGIAAADLIHEFLSMMTAGSPIPAKETVRAAAKDEL